MKTHHFGIVAALVACSGLASAQLIAKKVYKNLDSPLGFYTDPSVNNRSFIVQLGGTIRTIENGSLTANNFVTIPANDIGVGGERGLLSMAFHPDYATNHYVFLYFTNHDGDVQIARYTSTTDGSQLQLGTRLNIIKIPHPFNDNHNGGKLAFGPDGYLYIGTGDGGSANDPPSNAQNLNVLLGKMLRIDVNSDAFAGNLKNYAIPKGNPFKGGGKPGAGEIWAFGLRNPFRWSFDPVTGDQIVGDVGQAHHEEIDIVPAGVGGKNYGWRVREGLFDNPANDDALPPNLTDPIFDYDHGIGQCITGGVIYRGSALGSMYYGRYFFADFVSSRIWSIDPYAADPASTLLEHTDELGITGNKIASFNTNAQGEIMLSDIRGRIYRIDLNEHASIFDWLNRPTG